MLTLENVEYRYRGASKNSLRGVSGTFEAGKLNMIVGKSGSGKTTLLSLLAGLDVATKGRILHGDDDLATVDRDAYRAKTIGVVFQAYNLLTTATAIENVVLSMQISDVKGDLRTRAYEHLSAVGIDHETANRKVLRLSGGEQQRVGIARALSHEPSIIIADEPTGNLDRDTRTDIINILRELAHEQGKCVIVVTHSSAVAAYADTKHTMVRGELTRSK